MVVASPGAAAAQYATVCERQVACFSDLDYIKSLRDALPTALRPEYAGIDRFPIGRACNDADAAKASPLPNTAAGRLMRGMLGPNLALKYNLGGVPYNQDLLPDLEGAREVWRATDEPDAHEVIEVSRRADGLVADLAGIDVGYWGMSHFSAVRDTMFWPRWHPAPISALSSVRSYSLMLNERGLFVSESEAMSFRRAYLEWPWAEEEVFAGEIGLIWVGVP